MQGFRDNLEIHEMTKGRAKGEIYVSGLAEFRVKDVEDVLELIQQGSRNRAIRATECNEVRLGGGGEGGGGEEYIYMI